MGRVTPLGAVVALLLLALVPVAGAAAAAPPTPGVTPTTIELGSSGPLTGTTASASGFLRGAGAYFKYVNARGGVYGRKIDFTYLDDGSVAARAAANARRLIDQDHVFALFSVVGTDSNLAIRKIANDAGVPQVFSASGATTLGSDYTRFPWTIGYLPAYSAEGAVYAREILAHRTRKTKVAVLYESDPYGRDLLGGLRTELGATSSKLIVRAVGYDPMSSDVRQQVARLRASGANTLCLFAFGKFAIQAFVYADKLGWHPKIYVNDVASASSLMRLDPQDTADGAVSILWAKDPTTPRFAQDAGVRLAQRVIKTYLPGGSPYDSFVVAGMAEAYSLVDALRAAGANLTRQGLMTAVTHMNETTNPFLAPGIAVRTTPTSRFPITQVRLQRWHAGHWVPVGPVLDAYP
jgi:branched-chain amino acid transport system substrate-binding protein